MDNGMTAAPKRRRRPIGIKWKMLVILICCVSLFAVFLWVFEVSMLNLFYQNAKSKEIDKTIDKIERSFGNDTLISGVVDSCSKEYASEIWVYRATSEMIDFNYPLAYADGAGEGYGPFLERNFAALYENAKVNDGSYIAMVSMENFSQSYFQFKVIEDNFGDSDEFPMIRGSIKDISAMCVSIHSSAENEYVIVQRANIAPSETVMLTIENQVLFVGIVLIIVALALATILSKVITKPIVHINESAKSLANGKYNTEFSGRGYREIEELADTLNYASKELSKNDTLQKELISNISHDLRTPLTMIRGYGEMMRDLPDENTPENLQVIIDETTRLSELVNDMLDLSKIQAGTRAPEMRDFCLTEMVRSTMYRYEKLTMQEGYNIEFIADSDVYVKADRGMILQVVYNLINNAINYTGEDKYVCVTQSVQRDTVRIAVSDTGSGIAEEDIPNIWNRYYRVDKVHKRATVGSGLGLSIVKEILEKHNATYGVITTIGKGSTFWFELKTADSSEFSAEIVKL